MLKFDQVACHFFMPTTVQKIRLKKIIPSRNVPKSWPLIETPHATGPPLGWLSTWPRAGPASARALREGRNITKKNAPENAERHPRTRVRTCILVRTWQYVPVRTYLYVRTWQYVPVRLSAFSGGLFGGKLSFSRVENACVRTGHGRCGERRGVRCGHIPRQWGRTKFGKVFQAIFFFKPHILYRGRQWRSGRSYASGRYRRSSASGRCR